MIAAWLGAGFAPLVQVGVIGVVSVGVMLSLWLAPTLGGLRFGLSVAGLALLAGLVWR